MKLNYAPAFFHFEIRIITSSQVFCQADFGGVYQRGHLSDKFGLVRR